MLISSIYCYTDNYLKQCLVDSVLHKIFVYFRKLRKLEETEDKGGSFIPKYLMAVSITVHHLFIGVEDILSMEGTEDKGEVLSPEI